MSEYRERGTGRRAGTSRRRVLAAGAAPLLAGTGAVGAAPAATAATTSDELLRPVPTTEEDWAGIAETLGGTGRMVGMFFYVPFPRTDLRMTSRGVLLSPVLMGLQIGFARYTDGSTLLMGDLTVTEQELQPVTAALQGRPIALTAIHKHLLAQTPEMWWVHFHAHGHDALALAGDMRAVVDRTGAPTPAPQPPSPPPDMDTAGIDAALGTTGLANAGNYQCPFVRRETIVEGHLALPRGPGAMSALNFQPLGGGRVALIGDFAMVAEEAQEVLRRLVDVGIEVVSLHNHSLNDEPRMYFVHTWAVGDGVEIATAARHVLDATNVEPFG